MTAAHGEARPHIAISKYSKIAAMRITSHLQRALCLSLASFLCLTSLASGFAASAVQFSPKNGPFYHNPNTGRFWTEDSYEGIGSDPSSLHKYTYCNNNPVNGFDPSGNSTSFGEATTVLGLSVSTRFAVGTLAGFYTGGAYGAFSAYKHGGDASQIAEGFATGALSGALFGALLGPVPPAFWSSALGRTFLATTSVTSLSSAAVNYEEGQNTLAAIDVVFAVAPWVLTSSQVSEYFNSRYQSQRNAFDIQAELTMPDPPDPLPLDRSIGTSMAQQEALQADIALAQANGAKDIRVNQQQVNAAGKRVGINRPDLQYTLNGKRYYIEYERPGAPRGALHTQRILSNDPDAGGRVIVKEIPED